MDAYFLTLFLGVTAFILLLASRSARLERIVAAAGSGFPAAAGSLSDLPASQGAPAPWDALRRGALWRPKAPGWQRLETAAVFGGAGLIAVGALLGRPGGGALSGWGGFLLDLFAMLFPAFVLFLAFNVLDRPWEPFGEGDAARRRTIEQWIAGAIALALILTYGGLLLHKWGLFFV